MKWGIRVAVVYFEYESESRRSFINERLLSVCNYDLNINTLETDKRYQTLFRSLFRQADKTSKNSPIRASLNGISDKDFQF